MYNVFSDFPFVQQVNINQFAQEIFFLLILQHVEDRNLLVGHLEMFMEQYSDAQDLLLASSEPLAALEVCTAFSKLHVHVLYVHVTACGQNLRYVHACSVVCM